MLVRVSPTIPSCEERGRAPFSIFDIFMAFACLFILGAFTFGMVREQGEARRMPCIFSRFCCVLVVVSLSCFYFTCLLFTTTACQVCGVVAHNTRYLLRIFILSVYLECIERSIMRDFD